MNKNKNFSQYFEEFAQEIRMSEKVVPPKSIRERDNILKILYRLAVKQNPEDTKTFLKSMKNLTKEMPEMISAIENNLKNKGIQLPPLDILMAKALSSQPEQVNLNLDEAHLFPLPKTHKKRLYAHYRAKFSQGIYASGQWSISLGQR